MSHTEQASSSSAVSASADRSIESSYYYNDDMDRLLNVVWPTNDGFLPGTLDYFYSFVKHLLVLEYESTLLFTLFYVNDVDRHINYNQSIVLYVNLSITN